MLPTITQVAVVNSTDAQVLAALAPVLIPFAAVLVLLLFIYVASWIIYELLARPWRKLGIKHPPFNKFLLQLIRGDSCQS